MGKPFYTVADLEQLAIARGRVYHQQGARMAGAGGGRFDPYQDPCLLKNYQQGQLPYAEGGPHTPGLTMDELVEAFWRGFNMAGEEAIEAEKAMTREEKDRAYDNRRIKKAAEPMIADCAAHEQELQAAADPDLLFEQHGGGTAGTTHWRVERVTGPGMEPGLVRFRKTTAKATQLDQIAQWLPDAGDWARGRWRPVGGPKLPKWLVERVEAKLRDAAPAAAVIEAPAPQEQAPAVRPRQLALFA